ncbi:uncharacterized protein LOC129586844 [Paramacrobiotus metropolitanus]|uniref:uncharacterized protein LOC129586844 n=1 Tax=Paramacrobiotus metropolitanus TaxID=2943436 RepID=UPI002445958C|nr:uncharacterized protein LOC129586844 [Paramacrobiotus metropolitanus]
MWYLFTALLIGSASARNINPNVQKSEVCCADLGCFANEGPFWSLLNRPISTTPDCDLISSMNLFLNSRVVLQPAMQTIDPYQLRSITESDFRTDRDTKILIHGFTDHYDWPWWRDMVDSLLGEGDFNIVRLDWTSGNWPPYTTATGNTRVVGAYLAKFILILQRELQYDPSRIHIIGHSLGAHIAGYAGERVNKVGRISGIDPAGPYFTSMDPVVRLDPTDAQVVDTLITDGESLLSLGFGSPQAMGHLNFYVNGGIQQPGCSSLLSLGSIFQGPTSFNTSSFDWSATGVQTFYQTVGCNHWRALSVYTESIPSSKCTLKAFLCGSHEQFLNSQCFSSIDGQWSYAGYHANIGLAAPNVVKSFQTVTSERPPFCLSSYMLSIKLQPKTSANNAREESGVISATFYGTSSTSKKIALSEDNIDLKPGAVLNFLVHLPKSLGRVQTVVLNWESGFSILPTEWFRTKYLYVDGNPTVHDQNGLATTLLPSRAQIEEQKDWAAYAPTGTMTLTVALLAVTCALAIGVAIATPVQFQRSPSSRLSLPKLPKLLKSQEACCGDLGCFNSGGAFFDLLNRPINSVPNCKLTEKLKLFLNTRTNPVTTQLIDAYDTDTIANSNFNPNHKTIIIIHGFLDNYQWPWWRETVKEILFDGDYNVIRLDWSHGNTLPYLQASANVRLVGVFVARFLIHLNEQYGVDPANMHVVGHSLGAHGAGYVGEAMKKRANLTLGHITGLDPAGPYFTNLATEVRLDPTDADFVDTIVTDGETIFDIAFGSPQAMGHVNFYPNGGLNQPGCESGLLATIWHGPTMNSTSFDFLGTVAATAFESVACNHARAPVLFYESINNKPCSMKSFECSNYEKFLQGECFQCAGQKCATLGWHVDKSLAQRFRTKKYYTMTTEKSPFCTFPHKITFTLQEKNNENDAKTKLGHVYVTLIGTLATSEKRRLTADLTELIPGQTYTYFFETRKELGKVQSIIFYWENKSNLLNPLDWIRTHYIHLEGNLILTEVNENVSIFLPSRSKVEEEKDLHAPLINSSF